MCPAPRPQAPLAVERDSITKRVVKGRAHGCGTMMPGQPPIAQKGVAHHSSWKRPRAGGTKPSCSTAELCTLSATSPAASSQTKWGEWAAGYWTGSGNGVGGAQKSRRRADQEGREKAPPPGCAGTQHPPRCCSVSLALWGAPERVTTRRTGLGVPRSSVLQASLGLWTKGMRKVVPPQVGTDPYLSGDDT